MFPLACRAQDASACEVAVAALSLPADSTGLVYVSTGKSATAPLQLSTRYFSERVKAPSNVLQFFKDPSAANKDVRPPPVPLLALQIPADTKLAYAVLWAETAAPQQAIWQGRVFSAKDWNNSSLKVLNATSEQIGINAGKKQILLLAGKSTDFPSREWNDPFPVKIFQLKPATKCVFSSTWRVTAGRRELCFIFNTNHAISLRSIMEMSSPNTTFKN